MIERETSFERRSTSEGEGRVGRSSEGHRSLVGDSIEASAERVVNAREPKADSASRTSCPLLVSNDPRLGRLISDRHTNSSTGHRDPPIRSPARSNREFILIFNQLSLAHLSLLSV